MHGLNCFITESGYLIPLEHQSHDRYLSETRQDASGWLKCSTGAGRLYILMLDPARAPTVSQLDTLTAWALQFNRLAELAEFFQDYPIY